MYIEVIGWSIVRWLRRGSANVVFPDGLKGEFTLYMFYGDTEFCGVINL